MKKNFRFGQFVEIVNLDPEIDGEIVSVAGIAEEPGSEDTYIVIFSKPKETLNNRMGKFSALSIPESYLEPL